jgi:hypothetical protein
LKFDYLAGIQLLEEVSLFFQQFVFLLLVKTDLPYMKFRKPAYMLLVVFMTKSSAEAAEAAIGFSIFIYRIRPMQLL